MRNYKILIILICISIVFCVLGCSSENDKVIFIDNTEYSIQIVTNSDSGNFKEFPTVSVGNDTVESNDAAVPQKRTFSFDGNTYNLEYFSTDRNLIEWYEEHTYIGCTDEGESVFIGVNASNDQITSIYISPTSNIKCEYDEDYYRKIADSYADDYIDVNDYQVDVTLNKSQSEYDFTYYRKFVNYKTSEELIITIGGDGELIKIFGIDTVGTFDGIDDVKVNEDKMVYSIEKMFDEVYGKSKYENYNKINCLIFKLKDNTCAFFYEFYVNLIEPQKNGEKQSYLAFIMLPKDSAATVAEFYKLNIAID